MPFSGALAGREAVESVVVVAFRSPSSGREAFESQVVHAVVLRRRPDYLAIRENHQLESRMRENRTSGSMRRELET